MSSHDESEEYREFICNVVIIKALMQFVPIYERKLIQEWLKKLEEIPDGSPESKIRNDYTFYLLINVQKGSLSQPFNKSPVPGKLKPLCRILPDYIYEEVTKQLKASCCRMNKMLNENNDEQEGPDLNCDPSGFHSRQPRPRQGVTALCAAFSNYDDDAK